MKAAGLPIHGTCDPAFSSVRDAFAANFEEGMEVGACCAVFVEGRKVVDLWGGYTDETSSVEWSRDTIVNLMSVAKGVASLSIHRLVSQGKLELDEPIARYWPEFAKNGKDRILVRHALDHRAGIPIIEDPLWSGAVYDWDAMIRALEAQTPIFPVGQQPAYHTVTMSFLLGELVRRVTGDSLGSYFKREIAEPLELDYWLGLPESEHSRCARFIPWTGYNNRTGNGDGPPELLIKAWQQFDPANDDGYNSAQFRSAQIPGVSGHGNARAIAKLYAGLALGGTLDGHQIIPQDALMRATELQWEDEEPVLTHDYRMGLGFTLNSKDAYMGPNAEAFGHVGAGGSTGFADPVAHVGFSYGMNRMYPTRDNGPRARRLIEATYASLEGSA
ncbi:serine hydrolase [Nitratireductor sp. ZSWI3]|uniref:serine hydrolase domain-containing protein n=1 Tax=Nitratireductor sp. ZSWI3 TaxID=2966359 RepID=UPI00214FFCBC|nr:serine hydrolase domain-containing protein [Nitratireductor sp. ZSWI3]MCR4265023.1 beta-lactamase family protein [Nitratireductor sp. ZSWI3]